MSGTTGWGNSNLSDADKKVHMIFSLSFTEFFAEFRKEILIVNNFLRNFAI